MTTELGTDAMDTSPALASRLMPSVTEQPQAIMPSYFSSKDDVPDFHQLLKKSMDKVNALQQDASVRMHNVDTGDSQDLLGTMLAVQKSGLSFQALMQVRNKVVSAYEEVMRMQM
ncbi:MAG: flagellar hook-basal body complex protein FliE [Endozoicomonas sp. (ex Botrylloides leachii)]|nr:flagellar hook-basal body complex protein FliE [Endozoicomonas sp. (ex Botrylloides leachii)]